MIRELDGSCREAEILGNKGAFLCRMKGEGLPVPGGVILDREEYFRFVRENGIEDRIDALLSGLSGRNVRERGKELRALFEGRTLSDETWKTLSRRLDREKAYAVRSSGMKEDMEAYSFAGQYDTFLHIRDMEAIAAQVVRCYQSMFGETILNYLVYRKIDFTGYAMAVVIQEMVPAEYSGICFTVNPITGCDKSMLIELAPGMGDALVGGRVKPERYSYDWYEGSGRAEDGASALDRERIESLGEEFLKIQLLFGYPCDIEFALAGGALAILQARQITRLNYAGLRDLWSTADFKDGGVSAAVCYPYMWSLYEYIWEYALKKFLLDAKILKERELRKLGEMFYARCYWNLSVVKLAMSKIIGYREREFDSEYGIRMMYEGDGQVTKLSFLSLLHIIRMALAQKRIVRERKRNVERYREELLHVYEGYLSALRSGQAGDIAKTWRKLTEDDYLRSESTYFWQIFINTVHQSLYKEALLKYVSESEYLTLLSSIENISHLLPFYAMWKLSRKIRRLPEAFAYWRDTEPRQIVSELRGEEDGEPEAGAATDGRFFDEVRELKERFGYHSDHELDVAYPNYFEDITPLVTGVRDMAALSDEYSPERDQAEGKKRNAALLESIRGRMTASRFEALKKKLLEMREMLWWREEFRDISTRFYCIIRMYTLEYAKLLVAQGVLREADEIWFLKIRQLWAYQDGRLDAEALRRIIEKNRRYYNSYRNYMSENEIGPAFEGAQEKKGETEAKGIRGLGANSGVVTGTARVIGDFSEIDRLKAGDILVTRFTDTGWTPKFAVLSGIVTEYGGILCHAAIVAREYGIPAVVSCHDAMKKIRDGERVTVDGGSGIVTRAEKR